MGENDGIPKVNKGFFVVFKQFYFSPNKEQITMFPPPDFTVGTFS